MPSGPIRIVVVEDFRLVRDGIASLLRSRGLDVVGSASDLSGALHDLARARPRVALVDSAIGRRDAPGIVDAIRQAAPDVGIVVMDLDPRDSDVVDFVRAGASGLALKEASAEMLVATIQSVAAGFCVVPPQLTAPLFASIARGTNRARPRPSALRVTPREQQVCRLIAEGCSNKEIAARLHIAIHTVKSHVHSILEKLGARTRAQIAVRAADAGPRSPRGARSRSNGLAHSADSRS